MLATRSRRVLTYCLLGGSVGGTLASLRGNQYNLDNIGIVRLYRAGITVIVSYLVIFSWKHLIMTKFM